MLLWCLTLLLQYIPAILGKSLPTYTGYNDTVDPTIDLIFSTAGLRYVAVVIAIVVVVVLLYLHSVVVLLCLYVSQIRA